MNRFSIIFFLTFFSLSVHANQQMGWIEPEIDGGSHRSMGRVNSLITFYYNPANALFGYLRGFYATDNSAEASIGLGGRHKFEKATFGAYGFYDTHWSDRHRFYQQCTLGLDAYTADMDFRINGYLPFSGKHLTCKELAPNSFQFNFPNTFVFTRDVFSCKEEKALYGFDAEVGLRTKIEGTTERCTELNVYGGGYFFTRRKYKSFGGPRGRAELKFKNLGSLNCELTVGLQLQKNDLQAGKIFGFVRLNIPFGPKTREKFNCPTPFELTLEKRLIERIERLDVVIRERSFLSDNSCSGTAFYANRAISEGIIIAPGDDIAAIVSSASQNALLIVDGGPVSTLTEITMQPGQILISGGSTLNLTCPTCSNALLPTVMPGAAGTVVKDNNVGTLINLADNTTVQDLTLENGDLVLNGDGVSNVLITGDSISTMNQDSTAISLSNGASQIQIIDTAITMANTIMAGSSVAGIILDTTSDVSIQNTTIIDGLPASAGISISDSTNYLVQDTQISAQDDASGIIVSGSDGQIRDNTILAGQGIGLDHSSGITISNNTITTPVGAANTSGIAYFLLDSSSIVSNTITLLGAQSIGITADTGSNNLIETNTIVNQGAGPSSLGIQLHFETSPMISQNMIQSTQASSTAVRIISADQATISGNTIETIGNSSHGILTESLTNSSIVNNTIETSGATSHGIYLQAQLFSTPNQSVSIVSNTVTVNGASTALYSQGQAGFLNDNISTNSNNVQAPSGNGLAVEFNDNFIANGNSFTNLGGNVVTVQDSNVTGTGNTSDGSGTFCNSSGANTGNICFTTPAQCCPP